MKKVILTTFSALVLAACSSDAGTEEQQPLAIALSCAQYEVEATADTRAATNLHTSLAGDQVNVYMPGSTEAELPVTYTVDKDPIETGSNWYAMTTTTKVFLYSDQTEVYGLYPTAVTMTDGQVSYAVPEDQSSEDDYKLADLLYAKAKIVKTKYQDGTYEGTKLTFHHLMSKVIVNVDTDARMDVSGVYLVNVDKTLQFKPVDYNVDHTTLADLSVTDNVGQKGIKVGTTSGCCALIPPQDVMGKSFIDVECTSKDGRNTGRVSFEIKNNTGDRLQLLPGKTYTISLRVETWDFGEVLGVSVSSWNEPEEIENPRLTI